MIRWFTALLSIALLSTPMVAGAAAKKAPDKAAPKADGGVPNPKPADAKPADAKPADAKPVDAKPADAKPADAKPPETKEPKGVVQKLDKLGAKLEGPKLELHENNGKYDASAEGIAFTVGKPDEYAPKTFEEAKAARADFSPEAILKEEKTDDGWNIQFQNKGAMGENFFVWIRKSIAGKPVNCETTISSREQAAKVEKICLSLQKL